jgi:cytochrome P450
MAHLIYEDALYEAVRAEVDNAISEGPIGLETRIESCQQLVAVYNEVLRLITASASVREVAKPTDLGHVTLSPGATVLAPYRQLHFDKTVFGENADTFDPDRFLLNRDLAKSPSFRPFGGGTTYCAGRHIAKREVLTFVALAIHRYNIALIAEESGMPMGTFPRADIKKPTLGVLPPIDAADVFVMVSRKTQSAA